MEKAGEIISEVLNSGGTFRLYPKGSSMLPLIRQGKDSVLLAGLSSAPKRNDILLYRRKNGQYVLHRVSRTSKTGVYVRGDNQIDKENIADGCEIIGKVTEIYRGDKKISKGIGYKLYLFFFRFDTVRKIYFRVRKR